MVRGGLAGSWQGRGLVTAGRGGRCSVAALGGGDG